MVIKVTLINKKNCTKINKNDLGITNSPSLWTNDLIDRVFSIPWIISKFLQFLNLIPQTDLNSQNQNNLEAKNRERTFVLGIASISSRNRSLIDWTWSSIALTAASTAERSAILLAGYTTTTHTQIHLN